MIKLQIIGHLGKDAEVKTLPDGKSVINFSVAHTEKYNEQTKTIWVECAKWGDKTAIAQYLKKGTQVYVEGTCDVRTWESNGNHGASLQLRVANVQLLGSANGGQSQPQQQASNSGTSDDLPF